MKTTETETGLIGALRDQADRLEEAADRWPVPASAGGDRDRETARHRARLLREHAEDLEVLREPIQETARVAEKVLSPSAVHWMRIATRLTREGDER